MTKHTHQTELECFKLISKSLQKNRPSKYTKYASIIQHVSVPIKPSSGRKNKIVIPLISCNNTRSNLT